MSRLAAPWLFALAVGALASRAVVTGEPTASGSVPTGAEVVRIVGDPAAPRRTFWQRLAGAEPEPLFARPYGVSWMGDDLLVADPARGSLLRIDPQDRVVRSAPGLLVGPIGVAVCDAGIVVTDSIGGSVKLLDRRLRPLHELGSGLARPTGVACAGELIYVVETATHRIVVLDTSGEVRNRFGERGGGVSQLNFPAALAAAGLDLWIGDTLNFRVQRWRRLDGEFADSWGRIGDALGDTPRIKGIAVDSTNGRVWLTDAHLDQLTVFSASGDLLAEVGSPGSQPGQFSFPAGVALHPDGRIAVADSLNRRVQVFRLVYNRVGGSKP